MQLTAILYIGLSFIEAMINAIIAEYRYRVIVRDYHMKSWKIFRERERERETEREKNFLNNSRIKFHGVSIG